MVIARDAGAEHPVLRHVNLPVEEECDVRVVVSRVQEAVMLVRSVVLDGIVAEMSAGGDCCIKQLVLFGMDCGVACRQNFTRDTVLFQVRDVTKKESEAVQTAQLSTRGVTVEVVDVALEGCAWDAALVMKGFNWLERSMWVVQLDVMEGLGGVERIFRMMGTMGSKGSIVVVVYGTSEFSRLCGEENGWIGGGGTFTCDDPFALARRCGLEVLFLTNLRDGSARYGVAKELKEELRGSEIAEGVRFAVFGMGGRDMDGVSDITMQSGCVSGSVVSGYVGGGLGVDEAMSLGEFEEYLNGEHRVVRFELCAESLPEELQRRGLGVLVIGSEAGLGCWEAKRARRMERDVYEEDGAWKADVMMNVEAGDVEFKYAVVNLRGDIVAWEVGENRVIGERDERFEEGAGVRDVWRSG